MEVKGVVDLSHPCDFSNVYGRSVMFWGWTLPSRSPLGLRGQLPPLNAPLTPFPPACGPLIPSRTARRSAPKKGKMPKEKKQIVTKAELASAEKSISAKLRTDPRLPQPKQKKRVVFTFEPKEGV